jgi:hypothetical protein
MDLFQLGAEALEELRQTPPEGLHRTPHKELYQAPHEGHHQTPSEACHIIHCVTTGNGGNAMETVEYLKKDKEKTGNAYEHMKIQRLTNLF